MSGAAKPIVPLQPTMLLQPSSLWQFLPDSAKRVALKKAAEDIVREQVKQQIPDVGGWGG